MPRASILMTRSKPRGFSLDRITGCPHTTLTSYIPESSTHKLGMNITNPCYGPLKATKYLTFTPRHEGNGAIFESLEK